MKGKIWGPSMKEWWGKVRFMTVLVVGKDQDNVCRSFEIVSPLPEGIENSKEFFVVNLVVEFCGCHATRVECKGGDHHQWVKFEKE